MEGLNPKQREQVTKMPTVRLIAKLIQFGHTEDELAEFERNDLISISISISIAPYVIEFQ